MSYKDILRKRVLKSQKGRLLGKLSPTQIIGKPFVTEKAYQQTKDKNIYTFRVHKDANKKDIKDSLFMLYKVNTLSVRLLNTPYKGRANRKLVRRSFKKAIVTLHKDHKIELSA